MSFNRFAKGKPKLGGKGASSNNKPAAPKAPKVTVALPSTPQELEQVLAALLAPNTEAIAAATKIVDAFLKQPHSIPALLQQIAQSSVKESRQMAAVLLRRNIVKLWKKVSEQDREQAKSLLLQRLLEEPERLVRHSIGVLISTLAAQLVPLKQWNDLLDKLLQLCQHPSEGHREVAMMLFSALAENLTRTLKVHFQQLFTIFSRGLSDPSVKVAKEAVTALSTLVAMLDEDEPALAEMFSTAVEPLLGLMGKHADNDDVMMAGFEVLDCLAESDSHVLDPFIPKITEFMCSVCANSETSEGTREKSGFLVKEIIQHKCHKLLKPVNLIPALLQVSFKLVCEPFDDDDVITPQLLGIEILDAILVNLAIPKKDVFPVLMNKIAELVPSNNLDSRKGGFVIMAVMAEGYGTLVVDHLDKLVPLACQAALPVPGSDNASGARVRNAACIAIEQFADHLHPDISRFHEIILPTLLKVLTNPGENDVVKEKCCSALDVFCQHLDSDIGKYLHSTLPALLQAATDPLHHVSESAISAIRAIATASKELFEPYLNQCMTVVGGFLPKKEDEFIGQRCRAIECIGAMGYAVGKKRFAQPISAQPGQNFYDISFHMVVQICCTEDFFELRESCYIYFADICEMMGEDFAPRLPTVMPLVLGSLFTDDGVELRKAKSGFNKDENEMSGGDDDDDDDEEADYSDSEDDGLAHDERQQGVVIRSAALDEKIAALACITVFLPTVQTQDMKLYVRNEKQKNHDIFTALWELSEYPHPYIRTENIKSLRELAMWFHRALPPVKAWTQGEVVPIQPEIEAMLREVVLLVCERLDEEDDRQCAAEACDALGEILQKFGVTILQQDIIVGDFDEDEEAAASAQQQGGASKHKVPLSKHLLELIVRFLKEKAPCQIPEDVENEEDRSEIEDHDFVLMESVSDLIAILAEVMGAGFQPGFVQFFPLLERFLKPERQAASKGMVMGCFAEIVHWLNPNRTVPGASDNHPLINYMPQLIHYSQLSLKDPSPLVRRNGAFCTGGILAIRHPNIVATFPAFLQLLSGVYQPTTGPVDPNAGIVHGSLKDEEFLAARDNACSAICKMLTCNAAATGAPMSALIELVLSALPLQVDFNEAGSVYPCLMNLYRTNAGDITPQTERVVSIFSQVFGNPDVDTKVQQDMIAFCKELVRQAPQELERIFLKLPQAQQQKFKEFIIDPPQPKPAQ